MRNWKLQKYSTFPRVRVEESIGVREDSVLEMGIIFACLKLDGDTLSSLSFISWKVSDFF